MHRHGYKGRKFNRQKDQRRALIKGLAESFILNETIETTLPKAKEIRPYIEKLITKAKVNNLHSRRMIIRSVNTIDAAHKLIDEIAPKLTSRSSGYLRITKTVSRRGDNTQLARVEFVDKLDVPASEKEAVTEKLQKPVATKKTVVKKEVKQEKK
ncbi:MAG TPA: 50S ribosomal protein L17 [Candidatus Saccharimonadia bacterium]|nr:50S ribosomal protein L17 [Candidatus Saccharimonadia bacterium]